MRLLGYIYILLLLTAGTAKSQSVTAYDSLKECLAKDYHDTVKIEILNRLALLTSSNSLDSMLYYSGRALKLSLSNNYSKGLAEAYGSIGAAYYSKGDYELGLQNLFVALRIAEDIGEKSLKARILHGIGSAYFYQGNDEKSIQYENKALQLAREANNKSVVGTVELSLCECYQRLTMPDEAIQHCHNALGIFTNIGNRERLAYGYHYLGSNYLLKDSIELALQYFWKSVGIVRSNNFRSVGIYLYQDIGNFYTKHKIYDSAQFYLRGALVFLNEYENKDAMIAAYSSMASMFENMQRLDSANVYYKRVARSTQEIFSKKRADILAFSKTHYDLEQEQQKLIFSEQQLRSNRIVLITVSIALFLCGLLAIAFFRQYQIKRRTAEQLLELNETIKERNEEILAQSEELTQANNEIRMVNDRLELTVHERTEEIKGKNEKLIEFAFFNAHRVRGPLARILGLVSLLQLPELEKEYQDIVEKLERSAEELDDVVHEINQNLGDGDSVL